MSGCLAVLITWISLALSYYTPYPVSFYVTSPAFVAYLAARGWSAWARRPGRRARRARLARPWPSGRRGARVESREAATVRT